MSEQARCEICGEPMPPGEEMFKYHGYSGNCPKPPLPVPQVITIKIEREGNGAFTASSPDIPGLLTEGDTLGEVFQNLATAYSLLASKDMKQ